MAKFFSVMSGMAFSEILGILLMPLTYGFIGWLTNWVAIRMMFYPIEFKGIPPYLGWQGIVPRRASGLALKAVNTISGRLFRIEEFFEKIPKEVLKQEFSEVIGSHINEIGQHLTKGLAAPLLEKIHEEDKEKIFSRAKKESLEKMNEILDKLGSEAQKIFNLKNLVLRSLTGQKVHRIVEMFSTIGQQEFRFIEKSGWYFGALLGGFQMILWFFFPLWWSLPLQGAFVGYLTNYLALFMIFRPQKPKKIGPVVYQGLFHKRQKEVSQKYAALLAQYVLNGRNILEEILYRRIARSTIEVIQKDIMELLETKKLTVVEQDLLKNYQKDLELFSKEDVLLVVELLSQKAQRVEKILDRAMGVEKTIVERLQKMPPDEFEPILRTAFQEDEWILIVTGALLGSFVGFIQALYMQFMA